MSNRVKTLGLVIALALTIAACDTGRQPPDSPLPSSSEATLQSPPSSTDPGGAPTGPESPSEALVAFFSAVSRGDYRTAGSLYGSGEDEARELAEIVLAWRDGDPAWKVDPADFAAVLEKVCTGGFLCLPLRSIVSETQINPAETEFIVELTAPDGELFVLGPCCGATETEMPSRSQFTYLVHRDETGSFRVEWAPILEP